MSAGDGAIRRSGSTRWRRHFESTRDNATSSINNILQCSSKVVLHSRGRALPTLSGVRTGDTGSSAASSDVATQVRLRATLAGYGSSKRPATVSTSASSSVPNTGPLKPLATQTTTADDTKLLTRFDGRPDDYIPPKLTKSSGLAGGRVSRVTSQMERQLECVTVVTNFQKGDDFEPRKVSIPEYLTRPPAVQLGFETGEIADSETSEKREVEEAMKSLKKAKEPFTDIKHTWPPEEELPTLVHHNPSRNPLSDFRKLQDPVENREYKDGWARGSVFPSLGAGLKFSEKSGLNPSDPRHLISTWFKKKRAAALFGGQSSESTGSDHQPEIPNFLSLLQGLSLQPMAIERERKPHTDKHINPQVVPLTGGVVQVSDEPPSPPQLSIIKQAHMQAIAKEVYLDDSLPSAATPRKQKSEKEIGVQTGPPTAAPARPKVEPRPKTSPTSALKRAKSFKKGIRFFSGDHSTSSSSSESSTEASPRVSSSKLKTGALSHAVSGVGGEGEGQAVSGWESLRRKKDSKKDKTLKSKQKQEAIQSERAMQEKLRQQEALAEMRRRYNAYMNVVCEFPRRRLPRLGRDGIASDEDEEYRLAKNDEDDEEDEIASTIKPPSLQQLSNYPPWTYFPCHPASFAFTGSPGEEGQGDGVTGSWRGGMMMSMHQTPDPTEEGLPDVDSPPSLVIHTPLDKKYKGDGSLDTGGSTDEEDADPVDCLVNEALTFFVPGFEEFFVQHSIPNAGQEETQGESSSSPAAGDTSGSPHHFHFSSGGSGKKQGGFITAIPMLHALPQPDNVWREVADEAGEQARETMMKEWIKQYEEAWKAHQMWVEQQARRQQAYAEKSKKRETTKPPWNEEDVRAKQEEIKKEIQEEYSQFVEAKEVLEDAVESNPFRQPGPMGTCRGGRRAWVRFDRAARTDETRKQYASRDFRMLPDEDDEFDKIAPPTLPRHVRTPSGGVVGMRGGRRHRGVRQMRSRGRDRVPTTTTTIRDVNLQLDIRDIPRDSDKDYPELAEVDEDDVNAPMERAEFQVRRNNEMDRMLGDLLPLYEDKLPYQAKDDKILLGAKNGVVGDVSSKGKQIPKKQLPMKTAQKAPPGLSTTGGKTKETLPPKGTSPIPSGTSSPSKTTTPTTGASRPGGVDHSDDVDAVKLACPVQKWVKIQQKLRGSEVAVEVERTSGRILSGGQGESLPDVIEFFGQRNSSRFHESPQHSAVNPQTSHSRPRGDEGHTSELRRNEACQSLKSREGKNLGMREQVSLMSPKGDRAKSLRGKGSIGSKEDLAKASLLSPQQNPCNEVASFPSQQACFVGLLGARSQSRSPSPPFSGFSVDGGIDGTIDLDRSQGCTLLSSSHDEKKCCSSYTNGSLTNGMPCNSEQDREQWMLSRKGHSPSSGRSTILGGSEIILGHRVKKRASFSLGEKEDTSIKQIDCTSLPTFGCIEDETAGHSKIRDGERKRESGFDGIKESGYEEGDDEECGTFSRTEAVSNGFILSREEKAADRRERLPTFGYGLEGERGEVEKEDEDTMEGSPSSSVESEEGTKTLIACDLQKILRRKKECEWEKEREETKWREKDHTEGDRFLASEGGHSGKVENDEEAKGSSWNPFLSAHQIGNKPVRRRRSFATICEDTWSNIDVERRVRRSSVSSVRSYASCPPDTGLGQDKSRRYLRRQSKHRLQQGYNVACLHRGSQKDCDGVSCIDLVREDNVLAAEGRMMRIIKNGFDSSAASQNHDELSTTTGGSEPVTTSSVSLSDTASFTGRRPRGSICSISSDCGLLPSEDVPDVELQGQRRIKDEGDMSVGRHRKGGGMKITSYDEEVQELSSYGDGAVPPIFRPEFEREISRKDPLFDAGWEGRSGGWSGDSSVELSSNHHLVGIRGEDDVHVGSPSIPRRHGSQYSPLSVPDIRVLHPSKQEDNVTRISPRQDGHTLRRLFSGDTGEPTTTRFTGITTDSSEFHHRYLLYKKRPRLRTLFSPLSSATPSPRPSSFPWDDEVIPACRGTSKQSDGVSTMKEEGQASTVQNTGSTSCGKSRCLVQQRTSVPPSEGAKEHGSPRENAVLAEDSEKTMNGTPDDTTSLERGERNNGATGMNEAEEIGSTKDPTEKSSPTNHSEDETEDRSGTPAEQFQHRPRQPFLRRGCGVGGGRYDRLQNSEGTASPRGRSIFRQDTSSLRNRSRSVLRDSLGQATISNSDPASIRHGPRRVLMQGFSSQERISSPSSSRGLSGSIEGGSRLSTPRSVSPSQSSLSRHGKERTRSHGSGTWGMQSLSQVSEPRSPSVSCSEVGMHRRGDDPSGSSGPKSPFSGGSISAPVARYTSRESLFSDNLLGIGMFLGRSSISKSQPRTWDEVPCLPPCVEKDAEDETKKSQKKPFLKKGSGKLAGDGAHRSRDKESTSSYTRRRTEESCGASTSLLERGPRTPKTQSKGCTVNGEGSAACERLTKKDDRDVSPKPTRTWKARFAPKEDRPTQSSRSQSRGRSPEDADRELGRTTVRRIETTGCRRPRYAECVDLSGYFERPRIHFGLPQYLREKITLGL
ncbi:hypothetical protein CSUI_004956 [Cystoisospora suis]|uniref:Uncharacterized protein n=1 Tax=Cystoisospora suis TaxID=483139 RepID=A0A2C6KZ76_9APIC|nr:hypothetical protein CSUI_004956 [Cystoisospora suis]